MTTVAHDPDPVTVWPDDGSRTARRARRRDWLTAVGRAVLTTALVVGAFASVPTPAVDRQSVARS